MLAAVAWTGSGGNLLWSNPNNWSGHAVPTSNDDVTINAGPGTTIQIGDYNLNQTESQFIKSLTSNSPLDIRGGGLIGSLDVSATANLSANVTLDGGASSTAPGPFPMAPRLSSP